MRRSAAPRPPGGAGGLFRACCRGWILSVDWDCFGGCFFFFYLFPGPTPPPVYLMQNVSWLLHFNFSTCASNLLSRLHISFYIEAKRRRMASCVLCVAVAFFYPSENIIFNNIYNNDIIINKEMFMYGTLLPVDIFFFVLIVVDDWWQFFTNQMKTQSFTQLQLFFSLLSFIKFQLENKIKKDPTSHSITLTCTNPHTQKAQKYTTVKKTQLFHWNRKSYCLFFLIVLLELYVLCEVRFSSLWSCLNQWHDLSLCFGHCCNPKYPVKV